jgi:ABC-type branched-subunit amino acid transport system ATPase component/branched-subunit amino acid ABC-type transport system permease component
MLTFFTFVVLGLASGAIYSLTAFGMVLVYRGSGVVNFASGALATVGVFVYYELADLGSTPWPVALVVGSCVSGLLGAATHLLIMKPMRKTSPLTRTMATLGVFVAANAALVMWAPSALLQVRSFYPQGSWHPIHGLVLGYDQLIVLGISVVAAISLSLVSARTTFGLRTSAVAENQRSSAALGISPDVVATLNWFIGTALAGLAGILLAPILGLQIATITGLLFPSLAAALVGSMSRFIPALLGGLAIGIGEAVVTGYYPSTPGLTIVVPFVGVLALMLVRGQGIPDRGHVRDRLPLVGTGRIRPTTLAIGFGLVMVVTWAFGVDYADAMVTSMSAAIVLLSVVVVTGYAGQISLCQFALAGLGTFAAGRLIAAAHLPVLLAVVCAILVALLAGVVIGIPALRSRGVNLAVLTLGFAVVLQEAVFSNGSLVSILGDNIGPLRLFGIDLDATRYPARYATFAATVFFLLALVVAKVRRGALGRRLMAVRGSERAAASLGINVYAAKLFAFSLGAGIAAIGGMVVAFRSPSLVYSTSYGYDTSITALTDAVIGGLGFLAGPVVAAVAVVPGGVMYQVLDFLRNRNAELLVFIGGIGVIVVLWSAPDGMAKQLSDTLAPISRTWDRVSNQLRRRVWAPRGDRGPAPIKTPAPALTSAETPALRALAAETASRPEARPADRVPPKSLQVRNLSVRFGGVVALDDVSINVEPGEILGLIGPNGAGKTTLIDAITGFVNVSAGSIELDGVAIGKLSVARRSQLGIGRSFQNLELFEDLTVQENLQVACDPSGLSNYLTDLVLPRRSQLSARALDMVRLFELEGELTRKVRELPYGRRRLCAIARAAAGDPSVLLLDEPAAGLDSMEVAELSRLVTRLAHEHGVAVLLIEHNIDMIVEVCDRIVVLDFGKEIARGVPQQVRRNERVLAAYMGEGPGSDQDQISGEADIAEPARGIG